jgi:hypothetical protein
MSEKEKMKSEEIAKVLAENPTAKIYLAGLAQGMKLAKSMEPEKMEFMEGSVPPCECLPYKRNCPGGQGGSQ